MDDKCGCEYVCVYMFSVGFMELLSGFSGLDEVHFLSVTLPSLPTNCHCLIFQI